jgi:hypothetical protein
MLSTNKDILTVSLPIYIPFISSSCLIALARNSSTTLNRSGDSGHSCLEVRVEGERGWRRKAVGRNDLNNVCTCEQMND